MNKFIQAGLLLTMLFGLSAFGQKSPQASMSNPAAVMCAQAGGISSIKKTAQGELGLCTLPNGHVCEEWAYYRGSCK